MIFYINIYYIAWYKIVFTLILNIISKEIGCKSKIKATNKLVRDNATKVPGACDF